MENEFETMKIKVSKILSITLMGILMLFLIAGICFLVAAVEKKVEYYEKSKIIEISMSDGRNYFIERKSLETSDNSVSFITEDGKFIYFHSDCDFIIKNYNEAKKLDDRGNVFLEISFICFLFVGIIFFIGMALEI